MEKPTSKLLSFGVGCFGFGVKKKPPFQLKGAEYVSQLQSTLERISTASNIVIEAENNFKDISHKVENKIPVMDEGYGFFPSPAMDLKISFEIYIPTRIQKQLHDVTEFTRQPCEKYRVSIRNTYHFPVTFIEQLENIPKNPPSSGVVVVRKFLEKQLDEIDSKFIRFESLGPSPFHTDFVLFEDKENTKDEPRGFRCDLVQQRAYDLAKFYYNPDYYDKLENARDALFYELEDELGVFYKIVHSEVMHMHTWDEINNRVQGVLSAQKEKGMFRICLNLVQNYRELHETAIELSQFEANEIWDASEAEKDLKNLFSDNEVLFLEPILRKQIESSYSYPCSQIRDVLTLLETRRSNLMGTIIMLISAIIGGAVGSVITLLATSL